MHYDDPGHRSDQAADDRDNDLREPICDMFIKKFYDFLHLYSYRAIVSLTITPVEFFNEYAEAYDEIQKANQMLKPKAPSM